MQKEKKNPYATLGFGKIKAPNAPASKDPKSGVILAKGHKDLRGQK